MSDYTNLGLRADHANNGVTFGRDIRVSHAAYGEGRCIGAPFAGTRGALIMVQWDNGKTTCPASLANLISLTPGAYNSSYVF